MMLKISQVYFSKSLQNFQFKIEHTVLLGLLGKEEVNVLGRGEGEVQASMIKNLSFDSLASSKGKRDALSSSFFLAGLGA